MKKKALCTILALVMLLGSVAGIFAATARAESSALSQEQRNAIFMLNYITVLTQEINASSNSRLYLEEAYSNLVNNTYPNAVDERTHLQLTGRLDLMERYRMNSVKRERLQFLYEQNQARTIREALPNPVGFLSAVHSFSRLRIAASIVYMAVDSATSYMESAREAELQYLQDGWALDDDETAALHDSRKGTFSYMISLVRDYNLPGDLTLTESAVEEFVKWKNNENTVARLQFLESELSRKTYQCYSGYWLLLAKSYYENGDYSKCLEALDSYEAAGVRIFRRDYELARILPFAIVAVDQISDEVDYEERTVHYAQLIIDNTDNSDWALRYFVAQTYSDLYSKTQNSDYLKLAYAVALDNVTNLVDKQRELNTSYLGAVEEIDIPSDATRAEKTQIRNYNKALGEARKTELPPVYEPFRLNCELLLALATQLNISETEQRKIDGILHPKGTSIFLTLPLEAISWASEKSFTPDVSEVDFAGTAIKLPVSLLSDDTRIEVAITEEGSSKPDIITDWMVASVDRGKSKTPDIQVFTAIFTSEAIKKHAWAPGGKIVITITPKAGSEAEPIVVKFQSIGTKNAWYDYLLFWKGQNNEWYDYLRVWDNKVVFERAS